SSYGTLKMGTSRLDRPHNSYGLKNSPAAGHTLRGSVELTQSWGSGGTGMSITITGQHKASSAFDQELCETQEWVNGPRFAGITRLYTARQVVEQRGAIRNDYAVARAAAEGFYERLRQLFAEKKSITTFGPYSPGQAVTIKRMGIEGIYLGGWATSAK